MKKDKHGDWYEFRVGEDDFKCKFDEDYKVQGFWYVDNDYLADTFEFDIHRGFKTKENCEVHMRDCIKKKCKKLLRGLGGKTINIRGGYGDKS